MMLKKINNFYWFEWNTREQGKLISLGQLKLCRAHLDAQWQGYWKDCDMD